MASALDLMSQGIQFRTSYTPASALGMTLADTAVGFGGSVALGEVYSRYGDTEWGKASPYILGGIGKLAEVLLTLFSGAGFASGFMGSLGQVGVNAIGLEVGLNHGRKAKGIVMAMLPSPTTPRPAKGGKLPDGTIAVGALPPAADGRGLAWDQIQELASMH